MRKNPIRPFITFSRYRDCLPCKLNTIICKSNDRIWLNPGIRALTAFWSVLVGVLLNEMKGIKMCKYINIQKTHKVTDFTASLFPQSTANYWVATASLALSFLSYGLCWLAFFMLLLFSLLSVTRQTPAGYQLSSEPSLFSDWHKPSPVVLCRPALLTNPISMKCNKN